MVNPDAIEYARQLVCDGLTVIGYSPRLYVSAIGEATVHGRTMHLERVVESLRELTGWNVRGSKYPNAFEICFEIEGDDRRALQRCINEVENVALALALKNRIGFVAQSHSDGPRYKDQPFSVSTGLRETLAQSIGHANAM